MFAGPASSPEKPLSGQLAAQAGAGSQGAPSAATGPADTVSAAARPGGPSAQSRTACQHAATLSEHCTADAHVLATTAQPGSAATAPPSSRAACNAAAEEPGRHCAAACEVHAGSHLQGPATPAGSTGPSSHSCSGRPTAQCSADEQAPAAPGTASGTLPSSAEARLAGEELSSRMRQRSSQRGPELQSSTPQTQAAGTAAELAVQPPAGLGKAQPAEREGKAGAAQPAAAPSVEQPVAQLEEKGRAGSAQAARAWPDPSAAQLWEAGQAEGAQAAAAAAIGRKSARRFTCTSFCSTSWKAGNSCCSSFGTCTSQPAAQLRCEVQLPARVHADAVAMHGQTPDLARDCSSVATLSPTRQRQGGLGACLRGVLGSHMPYEGGHALEQVVVEGGLHGVFAHLQQQRCQVLQAHRGHWCDLRSIQPAHHTMHAPLRAARVTQQSKLPAASSRLLGRSVRLQSRRAPGASHVSC